MNTINPLDIEIPENGVDMKTPTAPTQVHPTESEMSAMYPMDKINKDCHGKKLTDEEVFDVQPLFFGYKSGRFGTSEMCSRRVPEDKSGEPAQKDFTQEFNKEIRRFQYGNMDVIADPEKLAAEKYLLLDYGRGDEQVLRGVFGYKDANYAGFQEWSKENPTVKLNLAVDYTTIPR